MSPDDQRHGTWAGYQLGCREDCCTTAARRYQKGRVLDAHRGLPRTVPSLGTRRRVEALACLGWTSYDISSRLGHGREWLRQVLLCDVIHRRTAERIASVYDELCMTQPPVDTPMRQRMVTRTLRRAERSGFAPPLAWDDIDTDVAPNLGGRDSEVDLVVVDRLLAGRDVRSTRAEKVEAMRRWRASGRSEKSLCDLHGWKYGRYIERETGAA